MMASDIYKYKTAIIVYQCSSIFFLLTNKYYVNFNTTKIIVTSD